MICRPPPDAEKRTPFRRAPPRPPKRGASGTVKLAMFALMYFTPACSGPVGNRDASDALSADDTTPLDGAGPDVATVDGVVADSPATDTTTPDAGPPPDVHERCGAPMMTDCSASSVRCVDDTAGPTQEYPTVSACAAAAQPGDTCLVHDGRYDEHVTPPRSGAGGMPIVFRAQGRATVRGFNLANRTYIDVVGFEITDQGLSRTSTAALFLESSSHIRIACNQIHDTTGSECIRCRGEVAMNVSDYITVQDNVLTRCGRLGTTPGFGVTIFGSHNLVEGNDISHLGDDFTRVTGGVRNVIRNNVFHDNTLSDFPGSTAHIDGMQNWCTTRVPVATHQLLIEGNRMTNNPSSDTHFVIYQDYGACGNSDFLIRGNVVSVLGDPVQINDVGTRGVRLYQNTFHDVMVASMPRGWEAVDWSAGSTGGRLINNIFMDAVRVGGNVYSVDARSMMGFEARGNLAYNSECGTSCMWGNPIRSEMGAVLNAAPNFVDMRDFALRMGSPAVDRGSHLTTVASGDSGSGTRVVLADAGFFQDGWAGTMPDAIAIGRVDNVAQIVSIDVAANAVTVSSPVTRTPGDRVWLSRNSSGRVVLSGAAPDIGAREFGVMP